MLLTAGDENVGSAKAILADGGALGSHVISPKHHVTAGRYRFGLSGWRVPASEHKNERGRAAENAGGSRI